MADGVPLRIGTRGSALAMIQATWVAGRLEAAGFPVELVRIQTAGDVRAPDTAWGEGAFVGAIESALLDGRIDAAVHSAKDVPTVEDPRLAIAAFTAREDPRDALVCRVRGTTLPTLPHGSRVGTDSPRRVAFIRAARPDLVVHPLSGNVDTRLRKLDEGRTDALVLAVAGLTRLGRADRIDQVLPLDVAVPAPGQGALALQVRTDDLRAMAAFATLDDVDTRVAVEAERRFLRATGGGCRSPIGARAEVEGDTITLRAAASRGSDAHGVPRIVREEARGPVADRLAIAEELAARIVRARRPRVLVTRPADGASALEAALDRRGAATVVVPTIAVRSIPDTGELDSSMADLHAYRWVVVTSANGARAVIRSMGRSASDAAATSWAAVGDATAGVLDAAGIEVAFRPSASTGRAVADELPFRPGERVLLARGDLADAALPERLVARGARVREVVAYETVEAPEVSRPALAEALSDGPFDALVFASGSAVRGLLALADPGLHDELRATMAVCIGAATAGVAREHGFARVVEAESPGADALADAVMTGLVAPTTASGDAEAVAPVGHQMEGMR